MTAAMPIYTALNVPTVTSYSSPTCLQWSGDGQACLATKTAVYIMTPDPGINFDTTVVVRSPLADQEEDDGQPALGWFRTMIQIDKTGACRWSDYSQEWGAGSLGSIDVTLCAVALSPSNATTDAGCVLATLSTNMDLALWASGKNCLKGEWNKICDVTQFLLDTHGAGTDEPLNVSQVLSAQITSVTWTPQADFGLSPTPKIIGSLLVGGHRGGGLTFLRYDGNAQVELVQNVPVADTWILHMASSSWHIADSSSESRTCEALLAYSTSDGAVSLLKMKQMLKVVKPLSPFGLGFVLETVIDEEPLVVFESDRRSLTALQWVEASQGNRILVYCKPGTIHFWSPDSNTTWSGHRTLALQTQKLSIGASPFQPVSGLQYVPRKDVLLICLFDGSLHVVHDVSREPSWTPLVPPTLSSATLSANVRSAFVRSEQEVIQFSDVQRISGFDSYDNDPSGTVMWIHEASRPGDFSYKHDAKHNSMLVVANIWDDVDDESLIEEFSRVVTTSKTASGKAALCLLRSTFFQLRNRDTLGRLHPRLLDILQSPTVDHSVNVSFEALPAELTAEIHSEGTQREFRGCLASHLFGWDSLMSLRMRLSFADFAWKLSEGEMQSEFGHVAQQLLTTISHRNLRTIIRHLVAVVQALTPGDIPFVSRMVIQSSLAGSPADLSSEGQHLSNTVDALFSTDPQLSASNGANFNERCPACQVEIPLQDITIAVCPNGHTWSRCSITTFIVSTPQVRTCIGCTRKAFLPVSAHQGSSAFLPDVARGWVVEELLEAVHRCLFCGNSFVSVL